MVENLVVCSKCGTINRLPSSRPAIGAKCGKCGAKVFAGHPEDVDAAMAPAYEAAACDLEPHVRFIKLNSDAEQAVASRLGIQGIPTMILFFQGREVARASGAMSATQIVRWVRDRLPSVTA